MSVIQAFRRTSVPAQLAGSDSIEHQLAALHALQAEHPFWNCRLLTAFAQGALSRDDVRYVFSQYHLYSSSFTRFLAAVMASSENDLHRAQLAQNLWEEGGGCEPSRRHAQIFRNFLNNSLGIDDVESSQRLADVLRTHFPHLHVVARARNVTHWVALRRRGIRSVERETFESALRSGRHALEHLGVAPYEARERADRFRRFNVTTLEEMLPLFDDEARRLSATKAARQQLARQFAEDKQALDRAHGAWSPEAPVPDDRQPAAPAPARPPTQS